MKKRNILFAIAICALMSSCSLFKEQCHCPKFGQAPTQGPVQAAVQSQAQHQ